MTVPYALLSSLVDAHNAATRQRELEEKLVKEVPAGEWKCYPVHDGQYYVVVVPSKYFTLPPVVKVVKADPDLAVRDGALVGASVTGEAATAKATVEKIVQQEKKAIKQAIDAITEGFDWRQSTYGVSFWQAMTNKLRVAAGYSPLDY